MEGKSMRVLVQTIMPLLMIALVVGQPNIPTPDTPLSQVMVLLPLRSLVAVSYPLVAVCFLLWRFSNPWRRSTYPIMPLVGDMVPPLIPGDVTNLIQPLIPGIGIIDLPRRQCAGKCALQCQRSKRNRFAAKICTSLCMLRCGIRMSNVVYGCTANCAHSVSPNSISDDGEAQSLADSCFQRCKNN